ncbi:unnamed protein product, partial [Penicillium nalgiovense]
MLRTNSVPSHRSPARPAILTSVANVRAGVQSLTLKDLTLSDEFDDIHCVFCLAEDEVLANVSVILRCQCKALSHLAYAEEWLEKRSAGFGTSCYALIRSLRVHRRMPRYVTSTRQVNYPPRENLPLSGIHHKMTRVKSQPRQRSVGPQGRSVEQSVENGPRRSARLGAHLP